MWLTFQMSCTACVPIGINSTASEAVWEGSSLLESHLAFPTTCLTLDFRFCVLDSIIILTLIIFCTLSPDSFWTILLCFCSFAPLPQLCGILPGPSRCVGASDCVRQPSAHAFLFRFHTVSVLSQSASPLREQTVLRTYLLPCSLTVTESRSLEGIWRHFRCEEWRTLFWV